VDDRLTALAAEFLPEWRQRASSISDGIAIASAAGLEAAELAAHQLAGVLGSFGFGDVGAIARTIEDRLRAPIQDLEGVASLAAELRDALEAIAATLPKPREP
jgi:HPt (histidine-containing phosphotransfer) domain-containing protein